MVLQYLVEYTEQPAESVEYMLRNVSGEPLSVEELRSWLDYVALAVEKYVREKYGLQNVEVRVHVSSDGKYNELEPRVDVGDYKVVLKRLTWTAKWGDVLGGDDDVEELDRWGGEIAAEARRVMDMFGRLGGRPEKTA